MFSVRDEARVSVSSDRITGTPLIASLSRTKSVEALAMDTRLDKLSEWVKGVERKSPSCPVSCK